MILDNDATVMNKANGTLNRYYVDNKKWHRILPDSGVFIVEMDGAKFIEALQKYQNKERPVYSITGKGIHRNDVIKFLLSLVQAHPEERPIVVIGNITDISDAKDQAYLVENFVRAWESDVVEIEGNCGKIAVYPKDFLVFLTYVPEDQDKLMNIFGTL